MGNKHQDKVAIITGSSQGIGKAIAIALAKEGATVILNGRHQERLNKALKELQQISDKVTAIRCDVTIVEESEQLINKTIEKYGRLDILINNAGISMRGKVADLNPEVFQTVFNVNVFGKVNVTINALPHIRKTKGSIIFISSLAGIRGLPFLSAYSSSKMALQAVAESIRIEEHEHGIHVGLIHVAMTAIEHDKKTIAQDGSEKTLQSRSGKKVLTTEEVAQDVLDNIQNRKFVTTQTLLGKVNKFLHARTPLLTEKIIINNLDKFEEGNK